MIQEFQLGELTKMSWQERLILHNQWLKSMHQDLQEQINKKNTYSILTEEELEKEKK